MTNNIYKFEADQFSKTKPKTSFSTEGDPYRSSVEKEAAKRGVELEEDDIRRILLAIEDRVQLNGSISKDTIANFVDAVLLLRGRQAAQ